MPRADITISDNPNGLQITDIAITDTLQRGFDGFKEVADARYASLDSLAPGSREAQERQREAVRELGLPLESKSRVVGIHFRLIPAGTFLMGSPEDEIDRDSHEIHNQVAIIRPFYMGKYEVTQGQWKQVMGGNPSKYEERGDNAPVEQVSWNACQEFLRKLSKLEGLPDDILRVPTEAEWEYACRAGTQTPFCYGNHLDSRMANFNGYFPYGDGIRDEYREVTTPVGMFKSNAWGLYDMHGNVWEWCQDWYGDYGGDTKDPKGPALGSSRVVRGGSCMVHAEECRSASRSHDAPDQCWYGSGLRLFIHLPS
jgi:formylglycine-generating enzyme required for sulfatase activity